jgi:hypothetical protein
MKVTQDKENAERDEYVFCIHKREGGGLERGKKGMNKRRNKERKGGGREKGRKKKREKEREE